MILQSMKIDHFHGLYMKIILYLQKIKLEISLISLIIIPPTTQIVDEEKKNQSRQLNIIYPRMFSLVDYI